MSRRSPNQTFRAAQIAPVGDPNKQASAEQKRR
jgi:hypothetical protein